MNPKCLLWSRWKWPNPCQKYIFIHKLYPRTRKRDESNRPHGFAQLVLVCIESVLSHMRTCYSIWVACMRQEFKVVFLFLAIICIWKYIFDMSLIIFISFIINISMSAILTQIKSTNGWPFKHIVQPGSCHSRGQTEKKFRTFQLLYELAWAVVPPKNWGGLPRW